MTKRKQRPASHIAAEIVAALMFGPKTLPELAQYLGVDPNRTKPIRDSYIAEFLQSGVIYICGRYGGARQLPIYCIQPSPFAFDSVPLDHPQDEARNEAIRRSRLNTKREVIEGKSLTFSDMAAAYGLPVSTIYARWKRGQRGLDMVRPKGRWRDAA